ncbi:oligomeric complex COG6 [Bipolaris maydis]|uniref:oligomeric complex COG6 n=1 Tax=Cochliobolus heterostrophus TaxID=5016 RepID=UPI0024D535F2|nr:oligomeric complex COG6 [Bipolaris maydis]
MPPQNGASPSSPSGTPASKGANALASRITSVLSASYADLEIRDALETLDARGVQNSAETRRQLRLDVQKEVIQCNGEIIKDFGQVAEQLKRIGTAISSLNNYCADMRGHIAAANKETDAVLEEANSLISQKKQVESKQQVLNAFAAHFLITEDDVTVLTSTVEPVNEEFFQILTRVKKIHHDCQVLLGTEDQRLGLEVLERSSKQLNSAFQKLYRWIQREFKTLDLENPQISASVRRSLRVLAERPALFQSCLDSFAEARESILSDAFHAALTGSTSENHIATKPIEFYAHDPLRYVGDMLAWAHSTTVSEREALENLFISDGEEIKRSIQAGLESEPWLRGDQDAEVFDGRRALNQLVSRDLAGVARLLRQRTEQVIQSHDDATLAYKIANLIGFYKGTFAKLLGADSEVLDVFDTLEASAMRQFRANMRDYVANVQSDLAVAPADLSPPEFLEEALQILKVLAKSYDTSLAATDDDGQGFQAVLSEALDPFLSSCENLQKGMKEPDNSIFAVNCLFAAKEILSQYAFTKERVSDIEDTIQETVAKLTDYQHQYLVNESGLVTLLEALAPISDSAESLKTVPQLEAFKPDALVSASQQLDEFLPSALIDAAENIKQLRNRKMIQDINEEAAGRFCEDFELVEGKIIAADELVDDEEDEDEQEPRLRDLFPRTSGEIRGCMFASTARRFAMSATTTCAPFSQAVVRAMRKLYPRELADNSWDNTGLLLEAPFNASRRQSNTVLLTIDLTKAVADEAIALNSSIVVAYHPIIFRGLKSLTLADTQQQSLLRLASHGISVYCPHTALDAAPGGLGDWLANIVTGTKNVGQSPGAGQLEPSNPTEENNDDPFIEKKRPTFTLNHHPSQRTLQFGKLLTSTAPVTAPHKREVIKPQTPELASHPNAGMGRIVRFDDAQPLPTLLDRIGKGLNNPKGFPIAIPQGKTISDMQIKSVGICAGSGSGLLSGLDVDLLFTGELDHHAALAAIEQGRVVISLFHSNSERGFLAEVMSTQLEDAVDEEWKKVREEYKDNGEFREALADEEVIVEVSEADRDPYA